MELAAAARRSVLDGRADAIWRSVDRLIDGAASVPDLRRHGLQLLAAERWRARGRPVPEQVRHDEQLAAAVTLTAPLVLQRVRDAWPGRVAVMKGPEVAALYPSPQRRAYSDLDLLVDDAREAQEALLAAGFRPVGDPRLYVDIHHLRPLVAPGLAVAVEVHDRPKWLEGLTPPATAELLDGAVSTATCVGDILTPPPAEHALLLAIHAWAHVPLARISHLLDVALMAERADAAELRMLARAWGVERAWASTSAAIEGLLLDGRRSWPLRSWARNLAQVGERTVLESHVEHWLASFSALPPLKALRASARAVSTEARPAPGETWRTKLRRVRHALRSPFARLSDHRRELMVRDAAADWTPNGKDSDS